MTHRKGTGKDKGKAKATAAKTNIVLPLANTSEGEDFDLDVSDTSYLGSNEPRDTPQATTARLRWAAMTSQAAPQTVAISTQLESKLMTCIMSRSTRISIDKFVHQL